MNGVEPAVLRTGSNRTGGDGPLALPPALSAESAVTAEAPPADAAAQPAGEQPANNDGNNNQEQEKPKPTYDLVNYVDHVKTGLGVDLLAPDQAPFGGYELIGPLQIQARSPITGLRPVIEQAISEVKQQDPGLRGEDLERRVAQRLTGLNDWDDLTGSTQAKIMLLSGLDLEGMSEEERERQVNHKLHSPQPFGEIDQILTPDYTIDMGYTHTLDKEWTNVEDQGGGLFRIWMVSNNNDGSHTGHSLGSFKLQLPPGSTVGQAFDIANEMVVNDNNNDRLYLDDAARNILYGVTPLLDFSKPMTHGTTTTAAPATTVAETTTTVAETTTTTASTAPTSAPGATTTVPSTVPTSATSAGG